MKNEKRKIVSIIDLIVRSGRLYGGLPVGIKRFVDTDAKPGGSGIRCKTEGVYRAYSSIAEWQADRARDLTKEGVCEVVYCKAGQADDVPMAIESWKTSPTNYITIVGENASFYNCVVYDCSKGKRE